MKIMTTDIQKLANKILSAEAKTVKDMQDDENGRILLPAILWWMGAPVGLLVVLWLIGIL